MQTSKQKAERRYRKHLRENLKQFGITPRRPAHVYRVTCTHVHIPKWARDNSPAGFSGGKDYVWMRHRMKASKLAGLDQEAGGSGEIQAVEYRTCERCGRVMLDIEAAERRNALQASTYGVDQRCGVQCDRTVAKRQSRKEGWTR